ncbi:hypothetical protein [Bacillus mycoides]|uniref:hypothetical protein n=1 Tax=Bacillus mycoides TaxID=1405 RepID=UPI003808773E
MVTGWKDINGETCYFGQKDDGTGLDVGEMASDLKLLELTKEEAKQHIDSLSHLTEIQRQDFKWNLKFAKDKQQVKDIRDKSDAKDAENKTKNLAEGTLGKIEEIKGFHIGSSKLVFLMNKREDVKITDIVVRLPLSSKDFETVWKPDTMEHPPKYPDVSVFTKLDNNYYTAPLDTEFLINFFNDKNNVGKTLEFQIVLRNSKREESLFVKQTLGSSLETTKEEAKQHIDSLSHLTETEKKHLKRM